MKNRLMDKWINLARIIVKKNVDWHTFKANCRVVLLLYIKITYVASFDKGQQSYIKRYRNKRKKLFDIKFEQSKKIPVVKSWRFYFYCPFPPGKFIAKENLKWKGVFISCIET